MRSATRTVRWIKTRHPQAMATEPLWRRSSLGVDALRSAGRALALRAVDDDARATAHRSRSASPSRWPGPWPRAGRRRDGEPTAILDADAEGAVARPVRFADMDRPP